ncbi:MAG: hypothetical protein FCKEOINB_01173 [Nitrosomonas sp.]|nr:hypothetical protein [Nitrosomonas sp.]
MALKGHSISGQRPDFYCDAITGQFAVEAKGFSALNVSDVRMQKYKKQSQTGPLQVHFSVASVSYNLYQSPKIKFYDPVNENIEYDSDLNSRLRDLYYWSVLEFIEAASHLSNEHEFSDYKTYIIRHPFAPIKKILIHRAIFEKNWSSNDWLESLKRNNEESEEFYIDVDGIGLAK